MHPKSRFHLAVTSGALPCVHSRLHNVIGPTRLASTSTSSTSPKFPFPTHRNPTPHQIFHLPPGASQAEIKARYYELARTFHPDSPTAHALPVSVRHVRFHAITMAYDILRGKSHPHLYHGFADNPYAAELARRRRQHAQRQSYHQRAAPEFAEAGGMDGADEAWKDQVIIFVGLAVRIVPSLPLLTF
ncbi:hypothetical protein BJV78DRAFT_1130825 [Lactifluus subvellereus]|nr:hypothetical protein BJV78DRAFT_1130825 [Lactifluus subvellereus]